MKDIKNFETTLSNFSGGIYGVFFQVLSELKLPRCDFHILFLGLGMIHRKMSGIWFVV